MLQLLLDHIKVCKVWDEWRVEGRVFQIVGGAIWNECEPKWRLVRGTYFKSYCSGTQTNTHRTDCDTWTTESVGKTYIIVADSSRWGCYICIHIPCLQCLWRFNVMEVADVNFAYDIVVFGVGACNTLQM